MTSISGIADILDARRVYAIYKRQYKRLYDARDETSLPCYLSALSVGRKVARHAVNFYRAICAIKQDAFTSDREVAALGYAFVEAAISISPRD